MEYKDELTEYTHKKWGVDVTLRKNFFYELRGKLKGRTGVGPVVSLPQTLPKEECIDILWHWK